MNQMHWQSRLLSLFLILALLCGLAAPVGAAGTQNVSFTQVDNSAVSAPLLEQAAEMTDEPSHASTDMVRVSIVLSKKSTLEAGFQARDLAENQAAMTYRASLEKEQGEMQRNIERAIGQKLDVVWNLTVAANLLSANVAYGQIAAIENLPGVEQVFLEARHQPAVVDTELPADPNMSTSRSMIGSTAAWAAGYTGAGSRIAVIDTGTDTDHQSFDEGAFLYSLSKQAEKAGMSQEDYLKKLNLLDTEEIAGVLGKLHVKDYTSATADDLYLNTKLPFAFNYVDKNLNVTHDRDLMTEHGSHVAGIAAANAYIPQGDGVYARALDEVLMQGVAPDAQLITMKVFGENGGAYDSDYMVAIEDALFLGCDVVNLSLGNSSAGSSHAKGIYQKMMDSLEQSNIVVSIAAGNEGAWMEYAKSGGYLYRDDVSMQTNGIPGTYTNSLAVASVNNRGITGEYFTVGDVSIVYGQNTGYGHSPLSILAGEQNYVYIDGYGAASDWAAVGKALQGAIAVCSRGGGLSFSQKAEAAVGAGAIATIVYNNEPGAINMDMTGYRYTNPCVSVTQEDGETLKRLATPAGQYYTGKLTVKEGIGSQVWDSEFNVMSAFSSWGIPGSLEMKPEITAPGGNIYSVNGSHKTDSGMAGGSDQYESMSGTSMASPQVAGMTALIAQYVREKGLAAQTGLSARQLAQSLLLSTAIPQREEKNQGGYYPVLRQGAGLANVGAAIAAESYLLMGKDATDSYDDGKVKVELGDDPGKAGSYQFSFSIHNLTDRALSYALSADFFTQAAITGEDGYDRLSTQTAPLEIKAEFSTGDTVSVPAQGEAEVRVTVTLTDAQKDALNKEYPTGAYIEGFVYAMGATTDDGALGTIHSIPVLGFYGNWSDPSMFDVGSYNEYVTGDETRYPYLYDRNGIAGNYFVVTYASKPGEQYYFGGNPVMRDSHYMPERNAINSETGDQIMGLSFAPIRAGAVTRVQAKNLTQNGEVMMETFPGEVPSAFYYTDYSQWMYNAFSLRTAFRPKEVDEGDQLELALTLVPEYYVTYAEDGSATVNWDALGDGASLRMPMVVDNTAPQVTDVLFSLVNRTLLVEAKDNQYVSSVSLYNAAGTQMLDRVGANQEIGAGETAQYTLNMENAKGNKFLLQVTDYAMNTTTFKVEVQTGEQEELPEMIGFNLDENFWTGLTKESTADSIRSYAPSELVFYAATIVDHYVLAATEDGDLYVMPENEMTSMTRIANMGVVLSDMAYNPVDGTVYGVADGNLVTVDKYTGQVQTLGQIPIPTNTLACGEDGTFYCNEYGSGKIWKFTLDSLSNQMPVKYDFNGDGAVDTLDVQALLDYATGARAEIAHRESADFDENGEITTRDAYLFEGALDGGNLTGAELVVKTRLNTTSYLQAMEINPSSGLLCWTSYAAMDYGGTLYAIAYYFEIDPETGAYTMYNDLGCEMSCLIIPEKSAGGSWTAPVEKVSGIQLSTETAAILRDSTVTLTASVLPWNVTDRSVTWTSSDPQVASVDENGVVTGVGVGTAVITAASVLDPTVSASCTVTVETVNVTLKGAAQDESGNPVLFHWDLGQTTWTKDQDLDTSVISMTRDPINNKLYVMDAKSGEWNMHRVNPSTGKSEEVMANRANAPMWDIEYSQFFSTESNPLITAIYQTWFFVPVAPGDLSTDMLAFNLKDYVDLTGGTGMVAMASLGRERIDAYGTEREAERFALLDDKGYVWNIWLYQDEQGYMYKLRPFLSNLGELEDFASHNGSKYCSMKAGEDGNVYLAAYNGETTTIYQMVPDTSGEIYRFDATAVGRANAPIALYCVEGGAKPQAITSDMTSAEPMTADGKPSAQFTMARMAPASLKPLSTADVDTEGKEVTVKLTAKDAMGEDTASNNGLATVVYDASALELKDIRISGDYTAKVESTGTVTMGYIAASALESGAPIAALTFGVKEGTDTYLTVTHQQVNGDKPGYVEQLPVEFTHTHTNTELRGAKEATCVEPGYTGDTYCKDCGVLVSQGQVIPALGHDWDDGKVTDEPDCENDGVRTFTCRTCGETRTEAIAATGHTWDAGVVKAEPGCTEDGVMLFTCLVCHATREENLTATGHAYTKTVVAPTCVTSGYEKYVCTVCGYEYHDHFTEPLGHDYESVVTPPSCTEQGDTTHTCTRCDDRYVDGYTAPTGHSFSQWSVTKEPTCTEKGEESRSCTACGEAETRTVDAKGHNLTSHVAAPNCTEDGYTEHACDVCGICYRDTFVDALGHDWGEWAAKTEADCFHDGIEARTCARCHTEESRTVAANESHCPSKAFRDVDTSRWYHDGVDFVVRAGIMEGVGNGLFQPNGTLTRGQLVTTLYRMAGEPAVEGSSAFSDVDMNRFYGKAVVWAANNGIARGVSATSFAPNAPVTREQLVAFLYRYAKLSGADVSGSGDLKEFGDGNQVHNYALEPMLWAVNQGLVNGMNGLLNPRGNATRAQIAVIFLRYCEAK